MYKITLFILITIFLFGKIVAQERISDFRSGGSTIKNTVFEFEGKAFQTSIFLDDMVKTFQIITQDSVVLITEKHFSGIFKGKKEVVYGNHMILKSENSMLIYNLVSGELINKDFDFEIGSFTTKLPKNDNFILDIYNNQESLSYQYQVSFLGEMNLITTNNDIIEHKDEHFVLLNNENSIQKHFVYYNFQSLENDTLINDEGSYNFAMGDNSMFYQNDIGELIEFDYNSMDKTIFEEFESEYNLYNYIFKVDNLLYTYNFGSKYSHFQVFDVINRSKVFDYRIQTTNVINSPNNFHVYEGSIICRIDFLHDNLIIIDTEKLEHTEFSVGGDFEKIRILENGQILYIPAFSNGFGLIDINSRTIIEMEGTYTMKNKYNDYVKVEDYYIGSFYENGSGKSIFVFDLLNQVFYPADILDKTYIGFERNSRIIELKGEMLLLANDLYKIEDDVLVKINTGPIGKVDGNGYKLENGKLFFIERSNENFDGVRIYSYIGGQLIKEMELLGSQNETYILNYIVVNDFIYYIKNQKLYRFEKASSIHSIVDDNIFDYVDFISNEDYTYSYSQDFNLINENSIQKISTIDQIFPRIFKFKERLFILEKVGLFEIIGLEKIAIYTYPTNPKKRSIFRFDKRRHNLFFGNNDNGFYHYNGENINFVGDSTIYNIKSSIGDIVLLTQGMYSYIDPPRKHCYYNTKDNYFSFFLEEMEDESIIDLFIANMDTFLLTTVEYSNELVIKMYKVENELQDVTLIKDKTIEGIRNTPTFKSFGDEGILHTNGKISIIDKFQSFHTFNNMIGDKCNADMIELDGSVYFLSFDYLKGRQLHKVILNSYGIDNTEDVQSVQNDIYPNPTRDIIHVKGTDLYSNLKYSILNSNGKLVQDDILINDRIDVSGLISGSYILLISKGDFKESIVFIKI